MTKEKNTLDKKQAFFSPCYAAMPAVSGEGMAEASLLNYTTLFQNLGLDIDKLLKRFNPHELKNMLGELPHIFRDEQIQKIVTRYEENTGASDASLKFDIDEQIKGIGAYLKERKNTLHELQGLPQDALEQLAVIRRLASVEEITKTQETILNGLRQRYGNFDESNLVLFLVKYLL